MTNRKPVPVSELTLILQNAIDLIYESELLYKHDRFRRAYFLLMTASEELEKIRILAENPKIDPKIVRSHEAKHEVYNNYSKKIVAEVDINPEAPIKHEFKEYWRMLGKSEKDFELVFKSFVERLRSTKMMFYRNGSLYHDPYDGQKFVTTTELNFLRNVVRDTLSDYKDLANDYKELLEQLQLLEESTK